MPILKVTSGHTGCSRIKQYLEQGDRALAIEFANFYWMDGGISPSELAPKRFDWAAAMDRTRHIAGNDTPYRGQPARTFKHFMISPAPEDHIDLERLRELAGTWLLRHFPDHEAALVYHDDNRGHIPHAHIVVNNTNLRTGRRMHTDRPEDLNRDLQKLARERGLRAFDDENKGISSSGKKPESQPRTRQAVHYSRAEERIKQEGGYSWVADIRARVEIAKHLSSDEDEFRAKLKTLGVELSESKSRRRRADWVYSLADQPTRRVCGEKLGVLYGRYEIASYFRRRAEQHVNQSQRRNLLEHAETAVIINDLDELHELATAITLCRRYHIGTIAGLDQKVASLRKVGLASSGPLQRTRLREAEELAQARDFLASRKLLPVSLSPTTRKKAAMEPIQPHRRYVSWSEETSEYDSYAPQRSYERTSQRSQERSR